MLPSCELKKKKEQEHMKNYTQKYNGYHQPPTVSFSHNKHRNKTVIWKENYAWEVRVAQQYWMQFIMNYSPSYQDTIKSSLGVKQKSCSNRNMSGCCKLHCEVNIHISLSMCYQHFLSLLLFSAVFTVLEAFIISTFSSTNRLLDQYQYVNLK